MGAVGWAGGCSGVGRGKPLGWEDEAPGLGGGGSEDEV